VTRESRQVHHKYSTPREKYVGKKKEKEDNPAKKRNIKETQPVKQKKPQDGRRKVLRHHSRIEGVVRHLQEKVGGKMTKGERGVSKGRKCK